ncbi:hypothetical protein [Streptomyces sp. ICBB 8177]|uniref:hypothetical protein n=1 Tax=Streptomyces sp. ICBB 8177 TaxID=563922 RepID=UPI0018EEC53E|nr:hypothetical protein [Streptomyces sp. ICBB 8177]
MLRRGQARTVLRRRAPAGGAADGDRWRTLRGSAATGAPAAVTALLTALRASAATAGAEDRSAALAELLHAPPQLWLALDRAAREPSVGPGASAGHAPAPYGPAATAVAPGAAGRGRPASGARDDEPLRLLLDSFDRDGHRRQRAVERLALVGGPAAAVALALRADDWVPAVRERAVAALLAHVAPDEATAAVRVLARLERRGRAGEALAAYRTALSAPERRRTVRRLAAEPDPYARRFGMALALELGEYVRGDLARAALHDHDQVCRELCAQALLDLDPDQAGRLMWARSAGVRELAVAALPDDVPAARLVAPLADRSRAVRAQARWKLYRRGEPPVDVYRKQLRRCGRTTHPRLVAGLAAGLGECGDACDLPLLAVLAEDPSWAPVIRRAAVRALGRLAAGPPPCPRPPHGTRTARGQGQGLDVAEVLRAAAGDPAAGVAREALDALAATGTADLATLLTALERPESPVWRAALRAAEALGRLDRLELLLRAAADARPQVATRARTRVRAWLLAPAEDGTAAPERGRREGLERLLRRAPLSQADRDAITRALRTTPPAP